MSSGGEILEKFLVECNGCVTGGGKKRQRCRTHTFRRFHYQFYNYLLSQISNIHRRINVNWKWKCSNLKSTNINLSPATL